MQSHANIRHFCRLKCWRCVNALNGPVTEAIFNVNATQEQFDQPEIYCGEDLKEKHMQVSEVFTGDNEWIICYGRLHEVHVVTAGQKIYTQGYECHKLNSAKTAQPRPLLEAIVLYHNNVKAYRDDGCVVYVVVKGVNHINSVGKFWSKQALQTTCNAGEGDQFSHPAFTGKKVTDEQESREAAHVKEQGTAPAEFASRNGKSRHRKERNH